MHVSVHEYMSGHHEIVSTSVRVLHVMDTRNGRKLLPFEAQHRKSMRSITRSITRGIWRAPLLQLNSKTHADAVHGNTATRLHRYTPTRPHRYTPTPLHPYIKAIPLAVLLILFTPIQLH